MIISFSFNFFSLSLKVMPSFAKMAAMVSAILCMVMASLKPLAVPKGSNLLAEGVVLSSARV